MEIQQNVTASSSRIVPCASIKFEYNLVTSMKFKNLQVVNFVKPYEGQKKLKPEACVNTEI